MIICVVDLPMSYNSLYDHMLIVDLPMSYNSLYDHMTSRLPIVI